MKRFWGVTIAIIAMLASSQVINAQFYASKFAFGTRVGMNVSKIGKNPGDSKVKLGYNFMLTVEYHINREKGFFIESGFGVSAKGLKGKPEDGKGDLDINAYYITAPLYGVMMLNINDARTARFVIKTGPFVAYGIGGKTKRMVALTDEQGNLTGETEVVKKKTFGKKEGVMKRGDIGWALSLGIEVRTISLSLTAEQGLRNVISIAGKNKKTQNLAIALGFKY